MDRSPPEGYGSGCPTARARGIRPGEGNPGEKGKEDLRHHHATEQEAAHTVKLEDGNTGIHENPEHDDRLAAREYLRPELTQPVRTVGAERVEEKNQQGGIDRQDPPRSYLEELTLGQPQFPVPQVAAQDPGEESRSYVYDAGYGAIQHQARAK